MRTVLTTSPSEAAGFIRAGGLTAFPTETVYGLGADIFNEEALSSVFAAKMRPADNPLIAHIGDLSMLALLAAAVPAAAQKFIDAFFPGPLTVVLKKTSRLPMLATAGLDSIGVRMPRHPLALEFLMHCGTPVAAPSANLSGRPSPTTWQAVREDLDSRIDCILQGEPTAIGLESTVVDCTSDVPVVLRTGAISISQLHAIVPETKYYVYDNSEQPRSPGLRHKHYAPKAKVYLVPSGDEVESPAGAAFIGLNRSGRDFAFELICSSTNEYASSVFEFFRECDRQGIERIYCETVPEENIGRALMDRIVRAAQQND